MKNRAQISIFILSHVDWLATWASRSCIAHGELKRLNFMPEVPVDTLQELAVRSMALKKDSPVMSIRSRNPDNRILLMQERPCTTGHTYDLLSFTVCQLTSTSTMVQLVEHEQPCPLKFVNIR